MRRNYDDPVYKEWRLKVYKRDNFKCQMPNCKHKTRLQAHHIQKWSSASALRYDVNNGITLCRSCHDSIKDKEHLYASLFMEIIRKNAR
jgi:5-methylcytosine-specific restriction endonuclease McrA